MAQRFTQSQAAVACGVDVSTIKRRRVAGAFPGSAKNAAGRWSIPLEDLLAAGLNPGKPAEPDPHPTSTVDESTVIDLRQNLAVLRSEQASADRVHRAELAVVEARTDAVRGQLKAIEASKQDLENSQEQFRQTARRLVVVAEEGSKAARAEASNWRWAAIGAWVLIGFILVGAVYLAAGS